MSDLRGSDVLAVDSIGLATINPLWLSDVMLKPFEDKVTGEEVNEGAHEPFILLSLPISESSIFRKPEDMISAVLGCSVKKVKGCYHDIIEDSYLVIVPKEDRVISANIVNTVQELCKMFGEESFLLVNSEREALLCFVDDDTADVELGDFVRANPAEAVASGSWTLDGSQFWMCKEVI